MATELSSETRTVLKRYVDSEISNAELAEWLAQAEYDPDLSEEERNALARVRLVVIEVAEKRRKPPAILESVAEVLAASEPEGLVIALRAGSDTSWEQESKFTAAPSPLQRVGISP